MDITTRLAAVILDMDGTLHDTEVLYHAATRQAVAAVGFTVTDAFCHSLIGIPAAESDAMLRAHLGPDFPYPDYVRHYRAYCDTVLATKVPLKPGAAAFVDALLGAGLKVAVATSASRAAAERHLGLSGLRARIPVVVTRDDVARGKPYPDLFLLAAARLDVPPDACLAVEDSLNGIRAAHAAGMIPVMVPDLLAPTEEIRAMCFRVYPDLHEVRALVANSVQRQ
jgi:HAD superfamily hydrolase (TIGR01509 family)